jgi:hypothetical protein
MKNFKMTFKVQSVRTLSSPYKTKDGNETETIHYVLVNMKDLPSDLPLDVNPREPKMTTAVAKTLKNAVVEPETDFYINNRGIVIAAKSFAFDTANSNVTIDLGDQNDDNDKYLYGILDGGHTYRAIIEKRDEIPNNIEKYVRVEIITNVANITRLSDARNTSVQVSDIALFNLDDKFENIQNAIKDCKYASRIAYKDNEKNDIHISELLKLVFAFDIEKFPDDSNAPIQSYSGKAQVFKRYKESYNTDFSKALIKELPKLTELYDKIECDIPEAYNRYKKEQGTSNPRFGGVRGIDINNNKRTSLYLQNKMDYIISSGYIYPIFGAFRSLLKYDESTKSIKWLFDPIDIWEEVGKTLVQNTFESSNNPQLAGKDKQLWLSNYRIVETQSLRKLLNYK